MEQTKFQIGDILPIAMILVVAGIAITFGLNVQEDVKTDVWEDSCDNGYWNTSSLTCQFNSTVKTPIDRVSSYNASEDGIDAVGTLAGKLPIIATVVAAAIIIGVLIRYMSV